MPDTVTMTVCAGGNHVTLHVESEKGEQRTIALLASDLLDPKTIGEIYRANAIDADADLLVKVREEIIKAGAKDIESAKLAIDGKAYETAVEAAAVI